MIKKMICYKLKMFKKFLPLFGAIPEYEQIIILTNLGEPLVLKNKLTLKGIIFENATRRLIRKDINFINFKKPYKKFFKN